MSQLKLFLLGSLQILCEKTQIEFDTRKATALLVFLAVTGESHHRDALATLLWPELDQVRARAALRRTLSTLKNALPEGSLATSRETISIDPQAIWVDLNQFTNHITVCHSHAHSTDDHCEDCTHHLKAAADLYRGDFLAGFTLRDSSSFDDWQFFQSESIKQKLAQVLEQLSSCLASEGDFENAIYYARRWLAIDPLHEEAHRQLMRLYAASGRREASFRQYQECSRILQEELGVVPLEETVNLLNEIKDNRIYFPASIPSTKRHTEAIHAADGTNGPNLQEPSKTPSTLIPIVGRTAELEKILNLYHSLSKDGHLVVLEGEAGIGKTRLAEEFLAHAQGAGAVIVQARCFEGERNLTYGPIVEGLRIGLGQITQDNWLEKIPAAWLSEVARLLPELRDLRQDLPPVPQLESPGAQSRFFEAIHQFLLAMFKGPSIGVFFIDDMQWADTASLEFVNYLSRRLGGHPILILGTHRKEEDLDQSQRVQQMISHARRSGHATLITLNRLNQSDVKSLVERLSDVDLPQSVSQRLFQETEGNPFFLVEYLLALLEKNRFSESYDWPLPGSVRDLIHSRLSEVSETGAQLLTTAAVIGRSFGFDTLKEASGRGEEETITGLENLISKGLVEEVTSTGDEAEPFYDFRHDKLRSLVYEETGSARRRLLHRRVAEALVNRSRWVHPPSRLAGQIAFHFRLGGETAEARKYFMLAGEYDRSIHANIDALEHFRAALELDHPDRSSLKEAIGDIQTLLGEYDAALKSYQSASELSGESSSPSLAHKIGNVYQRQGEWEQAEKNYRIALQAALNGDAIEEKARILADWSLVSYHCKNLPKAKELALEALRIAEQVQDEVAESQVHNILGILARTDGDYEPAIAHLERSLAIAEKSQDPGMRVAALNNLARVISANKDYEQAIRLTERALELCILQGDRHREAALHSNLADLLHATKQNEAAIEHLKKSVVIFAEIGENVEDLKPEVWKLVDW